MKQQIRILKEAALPMIILLTTALLVGGLVAYSKGHADGYTQCYENYKPEKYFYTQYVLDTQKSDSCCLTVFCSPITTDSLQAVEMYKDDIEDLQNFLLKDSSQLWKVEFNWRHL